jgi:hypothetical protein
MVKVAVGAGVGERVEAVEVPQAASSMSIASRGRVPRVFSVFMGRHLPYDAIRMARKDNGHAAVALV